VSMREARSIVIRPVISEKSFKMVQHNRYTFEVDKTASKIEVGKAVAEIFDVTVTSVNTMTVKGKPRRQRYSSGHTKTWKKAIVTLKQGDAIELFHT
jgi:large subunit ribosomal protein L23